jgi:hypothetical protein
MYLLMVRGGKMQVVFERYEAGHRVKTPESLRQPDTEDWVDIIRGIELQVDPRLGPKEHIIERVCIGYGDSTGTVESAFEAAGFRAFTVGKQRDSRIQLLDAWLGLDSAGSPFLTIGRHCANLVYELPRYHYKMSGGEQTDAPEDKHDHGIEAIAAVCEYVQAPRVVATWRSNVDSWAGKKDPVGAR